MYEEGPLTGSLRLKYSNTRGTYSSDYCLIKKDTSIVLRKTIKKYHRTYLLKLFDKAPTLDYGNSKIISLEWSEMFTYWVFTEEVSELYYYFNTPSNFDWKANRMASKSERVTYFYCYLIGITLHSPYIKANIHIDGMYRNYHVNVLPASIVQGRRPRI